MSERTSSLAAAEAGFEPGAALGEVNPFTLIDAVNSASQTARAGLLLLLGLIAYVGITTAGVTPKVLLLDTPVALPILHVAIGQRGFFLLAPFVLVAAHFGLLLQHVMLARKAMEFDAAVRVMEPTHLRSNSVRHELNSYFFTQALAGPERSELLGGLLDSMFWLTIVAMPLVAILFIQVAYLPHHDVVITSMNRVALFCEIALLSVLGPFLSSRSTSYLGALARTVGHQPFSALALLMVYLGVVLFSLFIATVPDERLDRMAQSLLGAKAATKSSPSRSFQSAPFLAEVWDGIRHVTSSRFFVERNLSIPDAAITDHNTPNDAQPPTSLRGRDLRNADLSRSDLRQADLIGADLSGAKLTGANLSGAHLSCGNIEAASANPEEPARDCTNLTGADLSHANLAAADLRQVMASGANMQESTLRASDLGSAVLLAADFRGADLSGADLKDAKLDAADFSYAQMQAARLSSAAADGVNFQGAHLQGADFSGASLFGADLTGADLTAADFDGARIWQTKPPNGAEAKLADASAIAIAQPPDNFVTGIQNLAKQPGMDAVLGKLLGQMFQSTGPAWSESDEAAAWAGLKQDSLLGDQAQRRTKTAAYLATLGCAPGHVDGAVATGVVRRVLAAPQKADPVGLLKRLQSMSCGAALRVPGALVGELQALAEKSAPDGGAGSTAAAAAPAGDKPAATAAAPEVAPLPPQ